MSSTRPRVRRTSSTGRERDHVPLRAAARPDRRVPEQRSLDQDDRNALERERRDAAGLEPGRLDDLLRASRP